jgi:seryl-tRNA synthetase
MLDLKWIRKNPEHLDEVLVRRGGEPMSQRVLHKDIEHRGAMTQWQTIKSQKNQIDGLIAQKKQKGGGQDQELSDLLEQAAALKKEETILFERVSVSEQELHDLLIVLPNTLCSDVPSGLDETANQEVERWGEKRAMPWAKDHVTLGQSLGGMDFEQAAKVSGARFVYLRGELARLERALSQWMLDVHTQEFGFVEMTTPYLVNQGAMFAAGQLPKFSSDLFCTLDGRFLIPTAEVSLVNWAADKVFSESDLPLCLTALTPCFRAEAGSAGKDTHGMMRHHQFQKVELVVVCQEKDVERYHAQMTLQAETLLRRLDLPYRKIVLCSGDTGIVSRKTYDLEVWVPSQNHYREIASCSQCGEYQARRLKSKIKDSQGQMSFVHTLNGSGLPTGRTLMALLENHQQEDGSIFIPPVLHTYMGGKSVLRSVS